MRKSLRIGAMAAYCVAAYATLATAQITAPNEMNPPKEESSTTEHTIRIGGQVIPYKATASTILLKNDAGEPIGLMYAVAYTRSDVKDLSSRPISFFFNGGPG